MKLLTMLALVCGTSSLMAIGPCDCPFDGFYVGVAGGASTQIAQIKERINTFISDSFSESNVTFTAKGNVHNIKPWGEIFAGWGRSCSCFYFGGRLGLNFSRFNVDLRVERPVSSVIFDIPPPLQERQLLTIKTHLRSPEFTFDFKPGWLIGPRTLFFGLIGGAINRSRIEGDFRQISTTNSFENFTKKDKTVVGFRTGVGLEQMICSCISLQAAYVYTFYPKISSSAEIELPVPNTIATHTIEVSSKPRKQVAFLGLAYYF